ncbi:GLPGLI family protein [Halpernia humi]|uniref:GLPGLI family protein n=1 Tax=Halpernia humi TaxID=493375 RepID=A0A1H5YDA1_9FLAO|nr:GLPGLI family protein [Halpernia humi]SEG21610.1 GLPGLI family protein [Halpernia humi]
MKFIPLFLLFSIFCFSQKISFVYDIKYKLSSDESEKPNSETMILDIENTNSVFRQLMDKKSDSLTQNNKNGMFTLGVENQFYVKKNLKDNSIIKIITYLHNNYALPITEKLNWKILTDQKVIGKYKSQKAEVNYGGRKWTAWFTSELSYNDGPYIFNGLPGLILSIEDDKTDYSFNLIQVKKLGDLFDIRLKSIPIDWTKYQNLAKSFYNDPYDLNSKLGKTVTFTDANGKQLDINQLSKNRQKDIIENNNPIELNHKINYK